MNKAIVMGFLGSDPEVRQTQGGQAVANFSVATNEKWTGKDGQKHEKTEWHRIVLWGKNAENAGKYLTKGKQVLLEGKIQTRSWQDKEGVTRYTTEIQADRMQFVGSAGGGGGNRAPHSADGENNAQPAGNNTPQAGNNQPAPEFTEDDVPF